MARPREATNASGSILGAIGGAILGGPAGAFWGGLLGTAANPSSPMPLEKALAKLFASNDLDFANAIRLAKNSLRVMFSTPGGTFWILEATSGFDINWTADQLDDALYDAVVQQLESWRRAHAG